MDPKVYSATEHPIAPSKVDPHAFYVIQKLKEAGHSAYLVGGGVRDLLLQETPKDFDVSTSARPEEVKALFRSALVIGRRFRLVHVRFGKKVIEVSTFRTGATEEANLIVRDNEWGSEKDDAFRRDFTLNGLFYDPEEQVLLDYVGGMGDLGKRVLRTIGDPEVRFTQDPVRMIRLLKFVARFDFSIDPSTLKALVQKRGEIVHSAPARVLEELFRMLESGASQKFFHLLSEYGLLGALLPALSKNLKRTESEELKYLHLVDDLVLKKEIPSDRALLLACLTFPLFEERVLSLAKEGEPSPPPAQIAELAFDVLQEVFAPFFSIPKRMKGSLHYILTSQYRLVPLGGRRVRRPKGPQSRDFALALELLKCRSSLRPALLPHLQKWQEVSFEIKEEEPVKRRRRRRRRRPS